MGENYMKGIALHPLRLAALDRMTVLRVPMTNLGGVKLVERAAPADWNAGRAHPNMRRFEDWKDKDSGALFFIETGSVVFVPAPYAPGDYFVKETCYICRSADDGEALCDPPVVYAADGAKKNDEYPFVRTARVMPSWAARHYLTLGPPVPCRLGEVDVSGMQNEGVFASLMQDPCDMAKQIKDKYRDQWNTIYPKHTDPGTWTWGYPMEVRRR
jgi:hypothetical protein